MDLQSRYTAKHPKVQAVNDQLKDAQKVMSDQSEERTETTDDVNPIYRQLSLELKQERAVLAGLKARLAALDDQTHTIHADLRALNASELKIDQLSRDADLARDKFFQYAKNLEESRIDKELENSGINNMSVVLPASLNERPVSPSKPLVAIAALMLATAGTVVLVAGSEWVHSQKTSIATATNGHDATFPQAAYQNRVQHRAGAEVERTHRDELAPGVKHFSVCGIVTVKFGKSTVSSVPNRWRIRLSETLFWPRLRRARRAGRAVLA